MPYLLASNPVNYGKRELDCASSRLQLAAYKLNCVEALAAALYIVGHDEVAEQLLAKFSWGDSFWQMNRCVAASCYD